MKYEVFTVVKRPKGMKPTRFRVVFKTKRDEKNMFSKFKTRITFNGRSQEYGVNFWETFAPTTKYSVV